MIQVGERRHWEATHSLYHTHALKYVYVLSMSILSTYVYVLSIYMYISMYYGCIIYEYNIYCVYILSIVKIIFKDVQEIFFTA